MTAPKGVDHVFLKKRIEAMNNFEPNISNFDDSIVKSIEGSLPEDYSNLLSQPPFTSYSPNQMNTQVWTVYPVSKRPYFYSKEQGKGKGIEFTSGFDSMQVDLLNKDFDLPFDAVNSNENITSNTFKESKNDIVENDKILGFPKKGFWVGVGILSAAAIGIIIFKIKNK